MNMTIPEYRSTLKLTHYGRKSYKPYHVTIWFTLVNGELWIGSLDADRNWVKNLRGTRRALVDFGEGAYEFEAELLESEADHARYREAIAKKYPVLSRVVGLFVRNKKRAVIRLTPAKPAEHARRHGVRQTG